MPSIRGVHVEVVMMGCDDGGDDDAKRTDDEHGDDVSDDGESELTTMESLD